MPHSVGSLMLNDWRICMSSGLVDHNQALDLDLIRTGAALLREDSEELGVPGLPGQ